MRNHVKRKKTLSMRLLSAAKSSGMARSRTKEMTSKRGVGTRCYLAPEILQNVRDYDGAVDIFSLGIVMYSRA